jgi:hypothetical protein
MLHSNIPYSQHLRTQNIVLGDDRSQPPQRAGYTHKGMGFKTERSKIRNYKFTIFFLRQRTFKQNGIINLIYCCKNKK